MAKFKKAAGIIAYVLVFFLLFSGASKTLMHKQTEDRFSMIQKIVGFYNEEPHSFDVLFFGSSHMYCSLDPALFKEATGQDGKPGLDSYIFASQMQPLWISYYYLVEALKTQTPKTVVIEVNMLAQFPDKDYLDEATNHTSIDPLPFSRNKRDLIWSAVPKGERRYYLFHIMKYHDRWEKLTEEDFKRSYEKVTDPDKGYMRLEGTMKKPVWEDVSHITEVKRGTGKSLYYLSKMIELARAKDIEVVLMKTPSNATAEEKMYYNAAGELADRLGVEYWDFNSLEAYDAMDLNVEEDFYDQSHLNDLGVRKFVKMLGDKF